MQTKIWVVLVGLVFVFILFAGQWSMLIGNFLIVEDDLHPADVIHVIAGEDYRTDYAIHLYRQGLGRKLFFTGGWCTVHLYHHGQHAQARAFSQGVQLDAIAFDDSKVTSTYMEAERLKEFIAQGGDPVQSIIVVSDPFHMRRVRWTYGKVFGSEIEVQMAPVPFEATPFQQMWWRDPESRQNVREEYTKFLYYLLRYRYSRGRFRDWLVTLDEE